MCASAPIRWSSCCGQTGRESLPQRAQGAPHYGRCAHAQCSPAIRRVDASTPGRLGRTQRPVNRRGGRHRAGSRAHPQQGFRSCLGIMRLGKTYSDPRLEHACHRALRLNAVSYKSLQSILKSGLDRQALITAPEEPAASIAHGNIRGSDYYH